MSTSACTCAGHLPIYALVGAADFSDSSGEETLIYEHPDLNAKTIGILSYCYHGLCGATLIKKLGDWYLIDDGVIGYVRASESVLQSWYDGNGDSIMIAAKPETYIHMDYIGRTNDIHRLYIPCRWGRSSNHIRE